MHTVDWPENIPSYLTAKDGRIYAHGPLGGETEVGSAKIEQISDNIRSYQTPGLQLPPGFVSAFAWTPISSEGTYMEIRADGDLLVTTWRDQSSTASALRSKDHIVYFHQDGQPKKQLQNGNLF